MPIGTPEHQIGAMLGPMVTLLPEDRLPVLSDTLHRDYILTDYPPRCSPSGKLRPESLLRHALRREGLLEQVWPICETLRAQLGPEETVWGIKYGPSGFSLELYFYNFAEGALAHNKTVESLREILSPHLSFRSDGLAKASFMCSFEVDAQSLAQRDGGSFRLYMATGEENRRPCGFSYRLEGESTFMENHYWFYFAQKPHELADVVHRVRTAPRSGPKSGWGKLLPKVLRDCHTVCYAVKATRDCLYYSRVSSEQLRTALSRWPEQRDATHFAQLLAHHQDDFAHLSWDLGFDFYLSPGARAATIDKFGIHGVF